MFQLPGNFSVNTPSRAALCTLQVWFAAAGSLVPAFESYNASFPPVHVPVTNFVSHLLQLFMSYNSAQLSSRFSVSDLLCVNGCSALDELPKNPLDNNAKHTS